MRFTGVRNSIITLLAVAAPALADKPPAPTVKLVTGMSTHFADFVDPAVGLVFIDHFTPPGEGSATPARELHVCDPAKLASVIKTEIAPAITAAVTNNALRCDGLSCRAGGAGEWDPVLHFRFAASGSKLYLRAITIDDEVLVGESTVQAEHDAQDKLIVKLSTKCP